MKIGLNYLSIIYCGIGLIFSALIASTARNPQIRGQLFSYSILGQ
uniref:ATP synthase F0 subunit c n=1 Tax=Wolfiporia cocos TaxID=81056 RepID=A0A7G7YDS3_9APHY|nr:ATP synthase F0 subunit c [Wolfiporia cocos]QNH92643.1 ATP synthase F0 subunit c [Wolfiporia cocos]QNH92720.1 ATP synthase F0 subunit c [Wolfiporia cocos]